MRLVMVAALAMTSATMSFAFTSTFFPVIDRKGALLDGHSMCSSNLRRPQCLGLRMSERGGQVGEWNKYAKAGLEQPLSPKRQPEGPLAEDPSLPMVEDIIKAADDRKAQNIWAARVAHLTYSTEFFVNIQGTSRPMLQAISANIEDMMLQKYERPIKWQGTPDSGWILLDYGEVIVNVMTPAAREYYDLENLWRNGEMLPLGHLITTKSVGTEPTAQEDDDEEWGTYDPFAKWDTSDPIEFGDLKLSKEERELLNSDGRVA